jgi:hypothetical protein
MKTTFHLLRLLLALLSVRAAAVTPVPPEVPLATAKALAQALASERLPVPYLATAKLYRNLDDAPVVWVLEYRSDASDTPLTVVAAATRSLPPLVMHWRGLPWHHDPEFLSRARENLAGYQRADAKSDWYDLRWEGPFDLWVPRTDGADEQTFASIRDQAELTRADVVARSTRRTPVAADAAAYIAAAWSDVDRGGVRTQEQGRPVAATPQYGYTRYIPRVPYLNQTNSPDCGIVSMMDILLYHDANGFPALVNESDLPGLRQRLRTLMEWTNEGTYPDKQLNGTRTYVQERSVSGFNFAYHARNFSREVTSIDISFAQFSREIDAGRPVQLNLANYRQTNITDDDYGHHAVCGVGYHSGRIGTVTSSTWAIVHDNWKGSFTNPWQDIDEPYVDFSQVGSFIKVIPPVAPASVAATTVVIDAPTNNSTVNLGTNASYIARVVTAANVSVNSVSFRVGDTIIRTTTTPDRTPAPTATSRTYSTTWNPSSAGIYRLMVSGVDSLNRGFQTEVYVAVPAVNAPPDIGWSSPQYDNLPLFANAAVNLSVAASDSDGTVASVEFLLLGSPSRSLGRATPDGGTFITLRGVTFTSPGDATLRAIATDNRGATASVDRRVRIVDASPTTNDSFAGAAPVPSTGGRGNFSSANATRETGEPLHAGYQGGRSLWWRWSPPTGTAVISTRGSSFDTLLAVYSGSSLGALVPITSNDDDNDGTASYVRFPTRAGAVYLIAVDGYAGAGGDIALHVLHSVEASPNDNFTSRTQITDTRWSGIYNNIVATIETGEPLHASPGGRSLWWTWTAPDNGVLRLSTAGSTFDTLLGVYTGSTIGALTRVATDDDGGPDYSSSIATPVVRGTAYQIAVDGFNGANGRLTLALSFLAAGARPGNDNFGSRTVLNGNPPISLTTTTSGATKEAGEPNHAGSIGGASVWWSWTAPRDGTLTVSTEGSDFDTVLAVYTGSSLSGLSLVGADDDSGGDAASRLSVAVRTGVAYHIVVDGYNRATGNALLNITLSSGAPAAPARSRLINVATRGLAGSGSSTMIAGFSITGSSAKSVMIRAIGPALRSFGVANALTDPVLTLYRGSAALSTNDNWEDNANRALVVDKSSQAGAFALGTGAKDAVILTTLSPGSYTAQITAAPGTSSAGVALVEVYDVDVAADAEATGRRLINLSTRGQIGTGDDIMIAGLVVSGTENKRVLIRGIGPALGAFGVSGTLDDPALTLLRGPVTVATNDNWSSQTNAAEIVSATQLAGGFALGNGSRDAAMLLTLSPGAYTVQLSGVGGTTGVGLIEAYELP